MTDTISSVEETLVHGDIVTTVTETKTMNADHSITTTTTVDKTDHADEDNHTTTISQTTTSGDLEPKIIRQIEYYFSDANMIRDKFLQNEITKDDGWIPLSVLTTFKRLQSLTTDYPTIINALKKSLSGLLQLNEKENKIRRHPDRQLPQSQAELESKLRNRTVFVKGFPRTDITLDQLLQFFAKYGSTDNIQMKKQFQTKEFNGLVSVVFPTEEKAREFVENSKQIPIKYENDGSILECSLQDDYYKDKALDLTTNRKDKQVKTEYVEKFNKGNLTGALIHLAGMAADATRELIKEKFHPFTKMPWIDFNKGDTEAWVRLNEGNTAKDVLEKVLAAGNGKLMVAEQEVTSRVVEGEEEATFWKEANEKRAAQRYAGGKRGRRGGQKRKRHQDQDDNENESTIESKKSKDISAD